jgi:hypothetical protein
MQRKEELTLPVFFFWRGRKEKKSTEKKKTIEKKKKCKERKELTYLLPLLHLGWNTPLAFSSPHIPSTLSSPPLSLVFHISLKLCATQAQELS